MITILAYFLPYIVTGFKLKDAFSYDSNMEM